MNMLKNTLCLALVSASFACSSSGDAVDIGTSRTGQKLEDYAASWVGYVEAYKFADGSDKVRITLDASGNGTLEVGDSAALPRATDPDVGYPASINGAFPAGFHDPKPEIEALFPGASYPIKTATVESARIRLVVNPREIERDWCALQTPVAIPPNPFASTGYSCAPTHGASQESGTGLCAGNDGRSTFADIPVDCGKLELCFYDSPCTCTASGCTVSEPPADSPGSYTQIDGALADAGESLMGTLLIGPAPGQRVNVRLTRQ